MAETTAKTEHCRKCGHLQTEHNSPYGAIESGEEFEKTYNKFRRYPNLCCRECECEYFEKANEN